MWILVGQNRVRLFEAVHKFSASIRKDGNVFFQSFYSILLTPFGPSLRVEDLMAEGSTKS
jgi:hypothetical protein